MSGSGRFKPKCDCSSSSDNKDNTDQASALTNLFHFLSLFPVCLGRARNIYKACCDVELMLCAFPRSLR